MQTFLPYPSFAETAACLDRQRLGKQRVETMQILRILRDSSNGWSKHPIMGMWRGYENALVLYGLYMIAEWKRRGYKNNMNLQQYFDPSQPTIFPHWLGREDYHASHRAALLAKKPDWYCKYWTCEAVIDYVWPV